MEELLQSALAHSGELALLMLFLVVLAESTAIVGLLVPGTVLMVAIGTLIGQGKMDFWLACLIGFIAAMLGDGISYWLGKRYRHRLQGHRWVRPHRGLLVQAKRVLRKHGGGGVFAGRFIGPTRPVLPLVAGMLAMPPRRFVPACTLACLLWTPAYLLPGIFAGAAVGLGEHSGISFPMQLLITAILAALTTWLLSSLTQHLLRRRQQRALPRHLGWGVPVASIACALALWFTVQHPLAPAYGERLWQLVS
ncbi:DedA family protein [Chitinilyticum piscinae]|uniref:DedA family protein n=1 Tax=Chitinilyticum piscinae TaxID=2866724 RepID=A0A8J7FKB5_9NEIS|nr:DedA family protein [Chitinilyticum piscinae]MBE9609252.1 DedA family protein [Chitinilyticum piscinae]